MKFGLSIPTCREGLSLSLPFASPEDVVRLAKRAEELDYHSVWGNDHITPPKYVRQDYDESPQWLEPLTTIAYVAAKTERIRLGTAVLVLPLRHPVWVAKEVSTIDVLSGGRMILCVGVGAYREEFERLRPRETGAHRGEMLSEGMQILKEIFTERTVNFKGKYYEFNDLEIFPKPIQDPFPLYSGGNSDNEIKRAVLYGNGWVGASLPIKSLTEKIETLRKIALEAGRDPAEFEIAPQVVVAMGKTHDQALKRFKASRMYTHLHTLRASTLRDEDTTQLIEANLIGTPQTIIDRIGVLKDVGVTMLASQSFLSPNVEDMMEHIQFFAEEVMPAFRS